MAALRRPGPGPEGGAAVAGSRAVKANAEEQSDRGGPGRRGATPVSTGVRGTGNLVAPGAAARSGPKGLLLARRYARDRGAMAGFTEDPGPSGESTGRRRGRRPDRRGAATATRVAPPCGRASRGTTKRWAAGPSSAEGSCRSSGPPPVACLASWGAARSRSGDWPRSTGSSDGVLAAWTTFRSGGATRPGKTNTGSGCGSGPSRTLGPSPSPACPSPRSDTASWACPVTDTKPVPAPHVAGSNAGEASARERSVRRPARRPPVRPAGQGRGERHVGAARVLAEHVRDRRICVTSARVVRCRYVLIMTFRSSSRWRRIQDALRARHVTAHMFGKPFGAIASAEAAVMPASTASCRASWIASSAI